MNEQDSDGEAALIPGLPNEVVLFHIIIRLPWYARPLLRALSKAWRLWINTSIQRPDILIQSRHHLLPLLRSHFLVCTFHHRTFIEEACHGPSRERRSGYRYVQARDKRFQICREWRELPSLQNYLSQARLGLTLMAVDGVVYAWTRDEPQNFMLKLDLAAGDWTWKKLPLPARFYYAAVSFNRKIYLPNISVTGGDWPRVGVHDMTTEEFKLVTRWNHDNLRVLRKKIPESSSGMCEEELYSFVACTTLESQPKLEIRVYDACDDSWMTKFVLPMPIFLCPDISEIKLANGDCFEPVPDGGINTVWIDYENSVLSWFNSSLHETRVDFNFNVFLEGKHVEEVEFIHGFPYGIIIEDEDDENGAKEETKDGRADDRENKQDPILRKRTIMKGKLVLETNNVNWEKVLDIGCFPDPCYLQDYTFMA